MEDKMVELNVEQRAVPVQIFSNMGMEQMDVDFQNMFEKIMPKQNQQRQLTDQGGSQDLAGTGNRGPDRPRRSSARRPSSCVENQGIIFLDELDKICGPASGHGPDVSRQGVQRDLLPVVEGTTVNTATARCGPTTSCSSRPGRFIRPSRPT